jgi:hypothetical protein
MNHYRVVAIPSEIADAVRNTLRAPGYGHPAHTEVATGHGPCRHCLRTFAVGEERRILFTYDPFRELGSWPLPGPVFVHAEPCRRFDEEAGYPEALRPYPVTIQAYGEGRRLLAEEPVTNGAVEDVIERLLQLDGVRYLHVRNTQAGCYGFRIERAA